MSGAFQNHLFLASAGTGKTYRLSAHFVGLLVRGVAPERILATTFTRKAAGEILSRVLQRLVQVALEEEAAEELSGNVGFPVTSAEARQVLPDLARQIHRFQVRTLDSHVIQIVRLFEAELRLPPGWTIIDDVRDLDLQDEALDEALRADEQGVWSALLRGLDPTGERRGVFEHVKKQIETLRAYALESNAQAWSQNHVPAGLSETDWAQALDDLQRLQDLPMNKAGKPNGHFVTALAKVRELAAGEQWDALLEKGLLKCMAEGDYRYRKIDFTEGMVAVLEPVLRQVAHELLGQAHQRNLASYALIERFEATYAQRKRERGWLRFEDLPRFLDPQSEGSPFGQGGAYHLDDIWMRLDSRIDHLLLDEFQDTSSVQWRTLQTLVDEIASTHAGPEEGGRSLFCVGDIKQSIYAWRQGEAGLLSMLSERYALKEQHLEDNYRSSPLVMDLCNRLFERLADLPMIVAGGEEGLASAARAFQEGYRTHRAKRDHLGGAAEVWRVVPADTGDKTRDKQRNQQAKMELTAERVAAIHRAAPHATIGVLFRARKSMAALLHRLQETYQLRASGVGGNPLTDSEAVAVMASGLHWLDHPGDVAAAFHVVTSHLADFWGLSQLGWQDPDQRPGRNRSLQQSLAAAAARLREEITQEGLAVWLGRAQPLVQAHYSPWDRQRFAQLIDHADTLQASDPLRPARWARLIRSTRVPTPWSAPIQVMTIHQSKGLEFDAVVLPDLDGGMVNKSNPLVAAVRPRPDLPYERVSRLPNQHVRKLDRELQDLAQTCLQGKYLEAIHLMYVAFTRAKHRIEWIVGAEPQNQSAARLVLEGLGVPEIDESQESDPSESGAGVRLWQESFAASWVPAEPKEVEAAEDSAEDSEEETRQIAGAGVALGSGSSGVLSASTSERRTQGTRTRRPSQAGRLTSQGSPTGAQALQLGAAHRRGTVWHAWLESVKWWDGESPIQTAKVDGLGSEQEQRWRAEWEQALAAPALRALWKHPGGEVQVFCERRFWWTDEHQVLWSGSIDRLVVSFADGQPVAARVVDYKTGYTEGEAAEIAALFQPQLEVYRRAAAQQLGLEPEVVSMTLALLDRGEVLDLEPKP